MLTLRHFGTTFRKNVQIVLFVGCVLGMMAVLGMSFYVRGRSLMEEQMKERLRDTAAVAVEQFNPEAIKRIHGPASMELSEFKDLVFRLRAVRKQVPTIRYAYIMRKTADENSLEFVADADALATPEELDANKNGVVEDDEEASYPGDIYDVTLLPTMRDEAFLRPAVDAEVTMDQWGSWISGYAPIKDARGQTVAILGLDMDAHEFSALGRSIFSPVLFLLFCIAGMFLTGYVLVYLWSRKVEELKRMDDEKMGVLRMTSHQLGESLTIFQWSMEGMRESVFQKQYGDIEEHLRNMEVGTKRLQNILGALRRAAQMEAGEFPYVGKTEYLRDVVMEAVHALCEQTKAKKQKIMLDLDGNLHLSLDRVLIGSVIRELIANAIDFSRPLSTIRILARREGAKALLEVSDDGCGIPPKDLPRIFGKFVRGANAHLSRPDGNGLGLFISKRIVERAGGQMWVQSQEGKGTTVTFSLPIA